MAKQMQQKETALARPEPAVKLAEVPEYLRKQAGEARLGNENVTQDDIVIPRLAICQSNSFERKESHAKYIEGLKEGMFFNTATKEIYGKEVVLMNVYMFASRIRWKGKKIGEGMLCRSQNAIKGVGDPGGDCLSCEFARFGGDDSDEARPGCTKFLNFPSLLIRSANYVPSLLDILIVSMKSLAITFAARPWNTLVNIRGNVDRWAGLYRLTTIEDHRESGDSWQPQVENASLQNGWVTQAQSEIGRAAYETIQEWRSAGKFVKAQDEEEVTV